MEGTSSPLDDQRVLIVLAEEIARRWGDWGGR